jgi:xanthine dehydrogenase YagR molybdenum-binding subunit
MENVSAKLGDSSLPPSPVEGGSWMAASIASAIGVTADAVRKELLRLAKKIPNSPLADSTPDV